MKRLFAYKPPQKWRLATILLVPVLLGFAHALGAVRLPLLERLDLIFYDHVVRSTMPNTLDGRITIVDIDESSLERLGHWPWSRDKVAALTLELLNRQQAAVVGFDLVFAEPDQSSGLDSLQALATGPLQNQKGFQEQLLKLAPQLDYDAQLAKALRGRVTVLGYYFTSDRDGQSRGVLPAPALTPKHLRGLPLAATTWNGHEGNHPIMAQSAMTAGFFNAISDADGVVRSMPLLAEYARQYYESLALAMFRSAIGRPSVRPIFAQTNAVGAYDTLRALELQDGARSLLIPVDQQLSTLIPFRGAPGPAGGSFRYVSAADVVQRALQVAELRDQIVLVGSTAPGLQDLRPTPVSYVYPGVEIHANMLSAVLDGRHSVRPDYAGVFDATQVFFVGLLLVFILPWLKPLRAIAVVGVVLALCISVHLGLLQLQGLAMPLANVLLMILTMAGMHLGYGYFFETRAKRKLASIFSTYVPPELVAQMVQQPERYTMQATHREMTVMFCDMRGFTALSEHMQPQQLQNLLNEVFSRLRNLCITLARL